MTDVTNHARTIDLEEAFWRTHYAGRPYVSYGAKLDDYLPAYRFGIDARIQFPDRSFSDLEETLSKNWYRNRQRSSLKWEKAKIPAQDAWTRLNQIFAAATAATAAAAALEVSPDAK